jgi:Fimbrial assembly protein (PilN)
MTQQINLMHLGLRPSRQAFDSAQALLIAAAAGVLCAGAALGLRLGSGQMLQAAERIEREGQVMQAAKAALGVQGAAAAAASAGAELERLQAAQATQNQLRAALDANLDQAGGAAYSDYFVALSRQAQSKLWLTRFAVAGDGRSLEIGGAMADPGALARYLRSLQQEPLFRGRTFARVDVKAVPPAADRADGTVEFLLRAAPGANDAAAAGAVR